MTIAGFTAPAPVELALAHPDAAQTRVLTLDADRHAVVLGAPGTGKSSLVVELVATRVQREGWSPDDIVVLTPNRLAANRLRDAISVRLAELEGDAGVSAATGPRARTPMSLAFSLAAELAVVSDQPPARLLTGSEQDTILRDVLDGQIVDGEHSWPEELHADIRQRRVFRTELRELLGRAQEHGLDPESLRELGAQRAMPAWQAAGDFWRP